MREMWFTRAQAYSKGFRLGLLPLFIMAVASLVYVSRLFPLSGLVGFYLACFALAFAGLPVYATLFIFWHARRGGSYAPRTGARSIGYGMLTPPVLCLALLVWSVRTAGVHR
jgi:Zn-dependent protease with chaperone function